MFLYVITNLINGKRYVGSTVQTMKKRWENHLYANTVIGKAIRKYGKENFTMMAVACARNHADLLAAETMLIAQERTLSPAGYNIAQDAYAPWQGRKRSDDTKRKCSEAQRGERSAVFGKQQTLEARAKRSMTMRLLYAEPANTPFFGRKHSDETKAKMRLARLAYYRAQPCPM